MTKIQSHCVEQGCRNHLKERRGHFKDTFFEFIVSQPLDTILSGPVDTTLTSEC